MTKLADMSFRAYEGHPIIVDLTLKRETLTDLVDLIATDQDHGLTPDQQVQIIDRWDYDAPATLMWPCVHHDRGIVLTHLCPCHVTDEGTFEAEADCDLSEPFGITVQLAAADGALDCELMAVLDWDCLPESLKNHTREVDELSEVTPGVLEARSDTVLDPWRDSNYPDVVSALLFVGNDREPDPIYARVERRAVDPEEPDEPHWEATIAQVEDDSCPLDTSDGVWLGIARDEEGAELGVYALPKWQPSAEDYDSQVDQAHQGDLSLEIGARYYSEGMGTSDEVDRDHRIACFRLAEKFYLLSADQGNAQAMCNLGYVYGYGRLGERRATEAARWHKRAADLGHAEAAYKYGDALSWGSGVEKDLEQAYFYYEMSYQRAQAEQEHPATWGSAALRLAACCEQGRGCAIDLSRARDLYLEAEAGLQEVVQDEPWYGKQLQKARDGAARLAM